jgi:hypothetical protein
VLLQIYKHIAPPGLELIAVPAFKDFTEIGKTIRRIFLTVENREIQTEEQRDIGFLCDASVLRGKKKGASP